MSGAPDRSEMYEDLQELLAPGFLTASVNLEDHRISLRSLSQNDLQFLRQYANDDDLTWRLHLVAHSVWMVDGIPLLEEFPLAHRVVYDTLRRGSRVLFRELLGTCYGFFARMREANHYMEAFLYEDESRRMWRGTGSGRYPLTTRTAFPGVDRLGLNSYQAAWVTWNQMEDTRDEQEYVWSNTKVLVSLQSHKGYESLTNKDRQRAETEDRRRAQVQERAWHRFQYGPPPETEERATANDGVQKARTVEDLEDQMRRWIRGEHDQHDEIVEAYKNRIRAEQEERERQKSEIMAELRAKREKEEQDLGTEAPKLRPMTPEELAARRSLPRTGAKFITEADPVSRLFNRYLRPQENAGNLSVDEEGRIVAQDQGLAPSLDELVSSRRTVLER